jgi:integrase
MFWSGRVARGARIKRGIYKDSNGVYYIRYKHAGTDYERAIGKDLRLAEIALEEIRNDIRIKKKCGQGYEYAKKLQRNQKPRLFEDAAKDYLDERASNKASTLRSYNSKLRAHLLPEFGKVPIRDITDSHLRKFQAQLTNSRYGEADRQLSPRTVNNTMEVMRLILNQEFREGRIERDPAKAVRPVPQQKQDIDPFSSEELESVLSFIDPYYRPLFEVLAFTGARPGEVKALRWSDIHWSAEKLRIGKARVDGIESLPKTKASQRDVPMAPRVVQALQEQKTHAVRSVEGHVFCDKNGKPIDDHLDRLWARAEGKAGVRHRRSYQLRHTFATMCIINGAPLPYIAKIGGWSTIDVLIRNYTGWIDSYTQEQDDLLKELFKAKSAISPDDTSGEKAG